MLGTTLAAAPAPVVGVLGIPSPEIGRPLYDRLFGAGLRELGYHEGRSLVIEYRWASGDTTRYPKLARELIERRPAVILAPCGSGLRAIREIDRTVPVIVICADLSNFFGEIASLSRPGGYSTGITFLSQEAVGKRLELLREILPGLSRLAVLDQSDEPSAETWSELERLKPRLGLALQRVPVARSEEFEAAFDAIVRERAQALYVFPTHLNIGQRVRIAELARKHRIATVSELSANVDAGGLLSYGASFREWLGKTAPMYVDKILKGAKPGDLPVVQPTQFELVVNLKTAKALGIKIPQSLLLRADRVIE
ncbi:MAG: ABC transporter substrate-binding protein [Betaproteobacteria bacterium]|nr:ABC transporter substrate-binding protein [Betaproteobacteria bacterium]